MNGQDLPENIGKRIPVSSRVWAFISAVVLVILLVACQQTSAGINTPTIQVNPTEVRPVVSSATVSLPQPSQPVQVTETAISTLPATAAEQVLTSTPAATATSGSPVVFGAIGDYGIYNRDEEDVANLVLSWQPDFIITLGDNNYPDGAEDRIDKAIGQYFHDYIYPYIGTYGSGASVNRFFPSLGNHDWYTDNARPYLDYFTLPGNERYYDYTWGPVHLFAIDNYELEPDGVGVSSKQAEWLKEGLAASTSPWDIVYMHYPPYSSGMHGSTNWARWPYKEWGADVVLSAHDHTYERLEEGGLVYFVNGLGGGGRYDFENIVDGSQLRYNWDYGAMRVQASEFELSFEFITVDGEVVDQYTMVK
jgi:hypothetical protein